MIEHLLDFLFQNKHPIGHFETTSKVPSKTTWRKFEMASDDYANVKDYYMDGKINIANDHVWNKKRQDYGRDYKIGKSHSLTPILVLRSVNRREW